MIVKLFLPKFAGLVKSGVKRQTIRPVGKRPLPPLGTKISLRRWRDKPYRSKQEVLRLGTLKSTEHIKIEKEEFVLSGLGYTQFFRGALSLNDMANKDGFDNWEDFVSFFESNYGLPFEGVLWKWTNESEREREKP